MESIYQKAKKSSVIHATVRRNHKKVGNNSCERGSFPFVKLGLNWKIDFSEFILKIRFDFNVWI